MQTWVFFLILAVFALGMVWGFLIGRSKNSSQRRAESLESQLFDLRGEMAGYRKQVGEHFSKTADVVNAMTSNYRSLYDQLIKGAQTLCGEQVTYTKLNAADMRFIEHQADAGDGGAAPNGAPPQGHGGGRPQASAPAASTAPADAAPARSGPSIAAAMDRSTAAAEDRLAGVDGDARAHEEQTAAAKAADGAAPADGARPAAEEPKAPAPSGGAEAKAAVTESLTIH